MVETMPVTDEVHFTACCEDDDRVYLNEGQSRELWDIWSEFDDEHGEFMLIVIPEWLSEEELGMRRPFLFARVEYDDDSKGAVLFGDAHILDIGAVENKALTMVDSMNIDDVVTPLDITGDNEYIDEPGLIWVPRSQMTVFERINGA